MEFSEVAILHASFVRMLHENSQLQAENSRLQQEVQDKHYEATHDELTDLLNRKGLAEYLTSNPTPQALLFLDSTNFKAVNDNISHDRGDQLLVSTAQILRDATRAEDAIARDGGDEFIIILANQSHHDREQLMSDVSSARNRIEALMADFLADPVNADAVAQGYSLAIGIAIRESGVSYNQLKDVAEEDMKLHKSQQHIDLGQYRPSRPEN